MSSCCASAKTTRPVTGVGEKSRKSVSSGTSFELCPSPGSRHNLIGWNNYLVSTADPPVEGEGGLWVSPAAHFTLSYICVFVIFTGRAHVTETEEARTDATKVDGAG